MTPSNMWLAQFCLPPDFCVRIRKRRGWNDNYIGYLEKDGPCKQVVYFNQFYNTGKQTTLTQNLSSHVEKNNGQNMLQYKQIWLVKQLATALLQFYATPLLQTSWRSEDIIFFDPAEDSKEPFTAPTSPYLNVVINKSHSKFHEDKNSATVTTTDAVGNSHIYDFGIILLELAYQAPLISLQAPGDLTAGLDTEHADISTADRLSRNVCRIAGFTYANIVKKCLTCKFGCSNDLADPALQSAFYTNVVCELEALAKGYYEHRLGG